MKRRTLLFRIGGAAAAVLTAPRQSLAVALQDLTLPADFGPRLYVYRDRLLQNAAAIAARSNGRPVIAVVKNNAYGLGLEVVGPILDQSPHVSTLAVVKADEARALRSAGVRKPILLMAAVTPDEAVELVRDNVQLAPFHDSAPHELADIARRTGRRVPVHLYIDTGMNRLGMPYHRAVDWARAVSATPGVEVVGTFMTFTEHEQFDAEQLARFQELTGRMRAARIPTGRLHAASSFALFFRPDSYLDAVRPGLALYGAYPAGAMAGDVAGASASTSLRPAFSLRARVARVEQLRTGDTVSYGRNYVAEKPVWVATIPVGHADGYPRAAVKGCEILIGQRTYRVIGAVSASHCIVELGEEKTVNVGAEAVLVGGESPVVHPNTIAERAGISVYDVLMHLSAKLPVSVS